MKNINNLKTSYGNKKVKSSLKTSLVQKIFTNVSKNYDLMNDLMSVGTHRLWKKEFVDLINIQKNDQIIDIGSGTGDIASLIYKKKKINNIYAVDLNDEMLNFAKKRFNHIKKIQFIKANAENLPFNNNTFDKYIISFCLRNITNIQKALEESFRILKPGGTFYCLEFSSPESEFINKIYNNYKKNLIPWIGKKIANNKEAYKYLEESIDQFPNQDNLLLKIKEIGFQQARYINIFNGIVSFHIGYKL